jgi:hypothetical protein
VRDLSWIYAGFVSFVKIGSFLLFLYSSIAQMSGVASLAISGDESGTKQKPARHHFKGHELLFPRRFAFSRVLGL